MTETGHVFDVKSQNYSCEAALERLARNGFIVLRNLFDQNLFADAAERIREFAQNPAIAGVPGYAKVDHPKRMFNPFSVGGPLVELVLNEQVIDLVEAYMDSECIIAETNVKIDEGVNYKYFDLHSDFSAGWRKSAESEFELSPKDMEDVLGIGCAIYLHDTSEGAFAYCDGSHLLRAPHGPNIASYPPDERQAILDSKFRVEGQAGDLVLFDDRGFHGPDQPSNVQRTVILIDYYRIKTFGYTQVSPMAVWTSDLGDLSAKQKRVLGLGANFLVPPNKYTGTRFRRNGFYPLIKFLVEHAYSFDHVKNKIKSVVSRDA